MRKLHTRCGLTCPHTSGSANARPATCQLGKKALFVFSLFPPPFLYFSVFLVFFRCFFGFAIHFW